MDRPRRPRSHQLEAESRAALRSAIPSRWILRDLGDDYGIDAEIEVFDGAGFATGAKCYVQLKATDAPLPDALTTSLAVTTVGYYSALDVPVLLVRYHAPSRTIYTRWFHSLLLPEDESISSMRIHFSAERRWNEDTPNSIERELDAVRKLRTGRLDLPLQFGVEVDPALVDRLPPEALVSRLRAASRAQRLKFVAAGEWSQHSVQVGLTGFTICLAGAPGFQFATPAGLFSEVPPGELHREVLLGIAVALDQFGQGELTANLLSEVAPESVFARDPDGALRVALCLIRAKRPSQALELAARFFHDETTALAARMLIIAFMINSSELSPAELEFALTILDRLARWFEASDPQEAAVTRYNTGRILAGKDRLREALLHHLKAARLHSAYRRQNYWWKEAGGLLFLNGRYKASVVAYRVAVAGEDTPENRVLLADALLFAGMYDEALAEFRGAVPELDSEDPRDVAEWKLKQYVLESIIKAAGAECQSRAPAAAEGLFPEERPSDSTLVGICLRALKLDALCTRAWLNFGVASESLGEDDDALLGFLVAAVLDRGDTNAWADAATLALKKKEADLLGWIFACAQKAVGDEFVVRLADAFPPEASAKIHSLFSADIFPQSKRRSFELRVHGPDDQVQSVHVNRPSS